MTVDLICCRSSDWDDRRFDLLPFLTPLLGLGGWPDSIHGAPWGAMVV